MTIKQAANKILDEFLESKCEYDSLGRKEITWIIENNTEYDFEYYWVDVVSYDENQVVIDKTTIMVDYLPAREKRKVKHFLLSDSKNISITIERYSVANLSECNKEVHLNDLYNAGVLNYEEYRDIYQYLFPEMGGYLSGIFALQFVGKKISCY